MAQVLTDRRDIDFVLYEQFDVEEFTRHEKFQDYNKKTFDTPGRFGCRRLYDVGG